MITVQVSDAPEFTLMDGDNLTVTPVDEWGAIRCNGPFVVITPNTWRQFQTMQARLGEWVET